MKKTFLTLLFFFSILIALCQEETNTLLLILKDKNDLPVKYCNFYLKDKVTGDIIEGKTDERGQGQVFLKKKSTYLISVKDNENMADIEVPADFTDHISRTCVLEKAPTGLIPPDTIIVKSDYSKKPGPNDVELRFAVKDNNNSLLGNFPIKLFSIPQNKVYVSTCDQRGHTRFLVPEGDYYISIGKLKNYRIRKAVKPSDPKDIPFTEILTFVSTSLKETLNQDTITQTLPDRAKGTTEYAMIRIRLLDFDRKPVPNEKVWVDCREAQKVYTKATNMNGMVQFLVPKGFRYILNLKYERNVDFFEFIYENGIITDELTYTYVGSENIEKFFATAKRDINGFLQEFKSSPVEYGQEPKNYLEKTAYGFNLNFHNPSNVCPPMTINDKIYVSGGYFSPAFYSFDAVTGDYKWGVKLAESGASPSVFADGVLLINTESCTLYALEASTGKMLWSKWLGPYLFSTPSVNNGKVYAVYPLQLGPSFGIIKHIFPFALIAFDLQTGKIAWQAPIDAEVLASPVISNGSVYLTSMKGTVYKFDELTGTQSAKATIQAVTPPTILENLVYVSQKEINNTEKQHLVILNAGDLSVFKDIPPVSGKLLFKNIHDLDPASLMSMNAGRITHFKGKNYCALDGKLFCTDPKTGSLLWTQTFDINPKPKSLFSPVIAGNKIVISNSYGKINLFDPVFGKLIRIIDTKSELFSDPVFDNGKIYSGSSTGKMVFINSGDITLTGWNMWGKDGTHNTVIK